MTLRKQQVCSHAALFLALCIPMSGCGWSLAGGSPCGVRILSTIQNPGNGLNNFNGPNAQVIEENCGATVDFITTVRLVDQQNKPLGFNDGAVFSNYHGEPKINVSWKDQDHLLIDCPDCSSKNITLKAVKHNFTEVLYAQ